MARMEIHADKQALMSPMLRLMCGDTRTQIIRIVIPRLFGDVDLCNLAWSIKIVNPKGATDICSPHGEVMCSDDTIEIDWLVCDVATAAPGVTDFEVVGVDEDADGHPIVWKSGIGKILVSECLNAEPSSDQKAELGELDKMIVYVRGELINVIAAGEAANEAAHRANAAAEHIEVNGRGYGIVDINVETQTGLGHYVEILYETENGVARRGFTIRHGSNGKPGAAGPGIEDVGITEGVTDEGRRYNDVSITWKSGTEERLEVFRIYDGKDGTGGGNGAPISVTINGQPPDENGNFVINTVTDVEVAQLRAVLT